jgi:hypothetical protein
MDSDLQQHGGCMWLEPSYPSLRVRGQSRLLPIGLAPSRLRPRETSL